ncbi:MAG TPA: peptidoglycan editing factor PgeF [Spirochaetota bacterium]
MNENFFSRGIYGEDIITLSSTVIGTIGRLSNRIDYSQPKEMIRTGEKELAARICNVDPSKIFFLDQEHEDKIIDIDSPASPDLYCAGAADALTTSSRGFVLIIRSADCVPVMIHDQVKNVIAAVHSGWRSSALDICGKTIRHLSEKYGTQPSDCIAYVLPSIGPDAYQVSRDVADKFPGCFQETPDGIYLNLWKSVELSLVKSGVLQTSIQQSKLCTFSRNELYFSHRKGDKERNLNFIMMK